MNYFTLARPQQWLKNILIFAPIFFAREFTEIDRLAQAGIGFIVFCLVASGIYTVNDILDREQDKAHSHKKHRPVAAEKISLQNAIIFAGILFLLSFTIAFIYVPQILPLIGVWFVLNLGYSLYFKHVAIVDILLISFFYFLRVKVGGAATNTPISSWLILCVIFFSLFIIIGKRKAELAQEHKRKVLEQYNETFLDHLLTISTAVTLVSYGIYTILGPVPVRAVYSNFFVMLAIFRYLHIVYTSSRSEQPEKMILDKTILISVLAWGVFMVYIFYTT